MSDALEGMILTLRNYPVNVMAPGCSRYDIEREEQALGITLPQEFRNLYMLMDGGLLFESEEVFGLVDRPGNPRDTIRRAISDYGTVLVRSGLPNPVPFHNGTGFHVISGTALWEVVENTGEVRRLGESPLQLFEIILDEFRDHYPKRNPNIIEGQTTKRLGQSVRRAASKLKRLFWAV